MYVCLKIIARDPERGTCLYRCGNERYLLQVPGYKAELFGKGEDDSNSHIKKDRQEMICTQNPGHIDN